uniref:Putative secreted salivary peptide of 9.57 kDa n=1 Tax=Ixodes ricinus TaxID=34613 RepID=A0A090XBA0_IXORI
MSTIVLLAVIALGVVSLVTGDANHHHLYGVSFEEGKIDKVTDKYKTLKRWKALKHFSTLVNNGLQCNRQKQLTVKRVTKCTQS